MVNREGQKWGESTKGLLSLLPFCGAVPFGEPPFRTPRGGSGTDEVGWGKKRGGFLTEVFSSSGGRRQGDAGLEEGCVCVCACVSLCLGEKMYPYIDHTEV